MAYEGPVDPILLSHVVETLGSPSQFTYIRAGLSPPLNVESNRSCCWQSSLSPLGGGRATSVPTNVTSIAVQRCQRSSVHKRGLGYLNNLYTTVDLSANSPFSKQPDIFNIELDENIGSINKFAITNLAKL